MTQPDRLPVDVQTQVAQMPDRQPPAHNVTVTTDIPADMLPAFVDPRQIKQVPANLITNAYQAMPEGEQLSVFSYQYFANVTFLARRLKQRASGGEGHLRGLVQLPSGSFALRSRAFIRQAFACDIVELFGFDTQEEYYQTDNGRVIQ